MNGKKSKIVAFFLLFASFGDCLSQSLVNIKGYLIIEKFVYEDLCKGDMVLTDEGDFNAYFTQDKNTALYCVENALISEDVLLPAQSGFLTELIPIGELDFPPFGRGFLKEHDSFSRSELFESSQLLLKELKKFDFGNKIPKRRIFYLLYEIDATVVSGEYLKKHFKQCNIRPDRENELKCPFYFYPEGIKKLKYKFTITHQFTKE